jgi:hypothetical protein
MSESKEDPRSTDSLEFLREEYQLTGSYNPGMGGQEPELWHIYKNRETNEEEKFRTPQKGGKRKSRRNRKSKKSRKNRRKSNYRRR